MNKTVKVLQWSVAIINLPARKFETEFWQNKPDSSPPSARNILPSAWKIFCKFWLNILSSWFLLSNKTELSLVDSGRQKVAAQFAWISVSNISIYFKNILLCNYLSYGQYELERNNIYVDTYSRQEKTFVLSKCFFISILLFINTLK